MWVHSIIQNYKSNYEFILGTKNESNPKGVTESDMVVHAYNPIIQEAAARGFQVLGRPGQLSKTLS